MLDDYRKVVENYNYSFEDDEFYYLYRHLPLGKNALNTISEQTIYLTPPSKFNDPFDCVVKVTEGFLPKKDEFKEMCEKNYGSMSDKKLEELYKTMWDSSTSLIRSGEYWLDLLKVVGVTCFNDNPLNILMWSHYAGYHTGFMIEFKFPKKPNITSVFLNNYPPMPVIYQDRFPIIDGSEKDDVILKAFLQKSECWAYEKEWRIFSNDIQDDKERIVKIPFEFFSSVIKGAKFDKSQANLVDEAIQIFNKFSSSPITLYEASLLEDQYKLTVPNHPRLDVLANKDK